MKIKKYIFVLGNEVRQIPVFRIAVDKAKDLVSQGEYKHEKKCLDSIINDFDSFPDMVNDWVVDMEFEKVQKMSQKYLISDKKIKEEFINHEWKIE